MTTKTEYRFPYMENPVYQYTLPNKHTVITIQKPGEITNVSTWVKTGSINETAQNNGVSHFLEHLMFKGTQKMNPGEFDRILEARGALINAATWKDYTFYYITIPQGENYENLKIAVELHADMMLNATLPDEEIGQPFSLDDTAATQKRERGVVIEEIGMREDLPWSRIYNAVNAMMYTSHPYKWDVIGTRKIISQISRQQIYDYYKTWYTPENMVSVIVSDLPSSQALDLIREHFIFPKQVALSPQKNLPPDSPPTKPQVSHINGDIQTGFVIIGLHGPQPAQLAETIALDVVCIVLGEGRSSRLYQNLIEKPADPLFHSIGCDQYQFRDGNTFFLEGNFKAGNREEALKLLDNELNALQKNPISNAELDKAKKKLRSRFAENAETAAGLAESVGYAMTLSDNLTPYTKYLEVLEKLSLAELQTAIHQYLNPKNASIASITPTKQT